MDDNELKLIEIAAEIGRTTRQLGQAWMNNELKLIEIAAEIGGIAECSCNYTYILALRIAGTGKSIEEFTVGELLAMHRDCRATFNRNTELALNALQQETNDETKR